MTLQHVRSTLATISLTVAVISSAAQAAPGDAQVLAANGVVTFNDKAVKVGDVLSGKGTIKTSDGSSAKIYVKDARTISLLKANSAVEINTDKSNPGTFKLVEGLSRWVVGKIKTDKPVNVITRSAAMGVRGTEFLAVYNPVLGESEIISLQGNVEFSQPDNTKSRVVVKTGQWGGVGGRFGATIGKILDLPKPVLDHFQKASFVETGLNGAAANQEFHGHKVPN